MRVPPPPRAAVPVLAAAAGVVVAHTADYLALFPHDAERAAHLAHTGHGYWPVAVVAALAAAGVAMIVAAARGVAGARPARSSPGALVRFGSLLAWQASAFTVLEAGERAVAGLSPNVLLHAPEFWLGLLLQVPVALLSLRLLRLVERTALRLAQLLGRSRRHPRPPVWAPPSAAWPAALAAASPARPRAPPLPARS